MGYNIITVTGIITEIAKLPQSVLNFKRLSITQMVSYINNPFKLTYIGDSLYVTEVAELLKKYKDITVTISEYSESYSTIITNVERSNFNNTFIKELQLHPEYTDILMNGENEVSGLSKLLESTRKILQSYENECQLKISNTINEYVRIYKLNKFYSLIDAACDTTVVPKPAVYAPSTQFTTPPVSTSTLQTPPPVSTSTSQTTESDVSSISTVIKLPPRIASPYCCKEITQSGKTCGCIAKYDGYCGIHARSSKRRAVESITEEN